EETAEEQANEQVSSTGGTSTSNANTDKTPQPTQTSNRYVYADDEYGKDSLYLSDDPRGWLFFGHGLESHPGTVYMDLRTDMDGVSAEELAEAIRDNPAKYNYTPGENIVLAVCYGGH